MSDYFEDNKEYFSELTPTEAKNESSLENEKEDIQEEFKNEIKKANYKTKKEYSRIIGYIQKHS